MRLIVIVILLGYIVYDLRNVPGDLAEMLSQKNRIEALETDVRELRMAVNTLSIIAERNLIDAKDLFNEAKHRRGK